MSDPLTRGSTPARARDASQRPGTFQKGHRKFGGRKKGTPNVITKDLKVAIVEAAHLVGSDGKGKDGLVGYLKALAAGDTRAFCSLLRALLPLQIAPKEEEKSHLDIVYRSAAEIREELARRGVPPALLDMTPEKCVNVDDMDDDDDDDDAEEAQAESPEATKQPKQE